MRFCFQDGEHEQERCDDCLIQASVNMRKFLAVFSTAGTAVPLTRLTEGDFALRERTDLAALFAVVPLVEMARPASSASQTYFARFHSVHRLIQECDV